MCCVCKLPSEGRQEMSDPLELELRGCKPTNTGAESNSKPLQEQRVFLTAGPSLHSFKKKLLVLWEAALPSSWLPPTHSLGKLMAWSPCRKVMFQFLKNYPLTTFRKVSCFACYGALSCGLASIKQLRLHSGTCSEVARTSTCCWSEVLSGQWTPETLNRPTASDLPWTLRRKAPWPQEFVFENTDLAVHASYFEICKDRETRIPAFPGWEDKGGREISAPDREMKQ